MGERLMVWFVSRSWDMHAASAGPFEVDLLDDRHRNSAGHAAFAAGASGVRVGEQEVLAAVLRAAEACVPGQGEYVDSAGQLWGPSLAPPPEQRHVVPGASFD